MDDPLQSSPVEPDLRHLLAIPQQDGNDIGEARPQSGLGVHVARRPGQAERRKDVIEERRHLVAEMAALAGYELVGGQGNASCVRSSSLKLSQDAPWT
jgi:hypothetical protein